LPAKEAIRRLVLVLGNLGLSKCVTVIFDFESEAGFAEKTGHTIGNQIPIVSRESFKRYQPKCWRICAAMKADRRVVSRKSSRVITGF
jgi:hypothetical protein